MSIIEKFIDISKILTETKAGLNILNKIKEELLKIKNNFLKNFSNFNSLSILERFKYILIYINNNFSKYGITPIITSILIYFMSFVSNCLRCEPVRLLVLSIVVFITQGISLYKEIENRCPGRVMNKLELFLKYLLMMTSIFIFGYMFLSFFFITGIGKILIIVGPGKLLIPTIIGSIVMVTTNKVILLNKALEEICK